MGLSLAEGDVRVVIGSLAASPLGISPSEVDAVEAHTRIDADGLGADSIELTELATRVSGFFRLHESGIEDELLRRRTVGDWTATVLRSWELSGGRITFLTSGSTGEPGECTHEWASLVQEIRALAQLFGSRRRIVGTVPRHHIYGFLFTVLLPRYLDIPFSEARDTLPAGLIGSLRPGDLLVSFPLRWEQLAKAGMNFPPGVEGVTSTGPCPVEAIHALRSLSLERMVEIYGSSETGGLGWREDPAEPYRLLPHWSLAKGGESLTRTEPTGRRSKLSPPDHLLERPGGFVVAGRRDHAVQVAGVNVYPERVAGKILSHPEVADCEVRPMLPGEGHRLKAFIVLKEEAQTRPDSRKSLEKWLRQTLSAPERPASLTFGEAVPRDGQGKTTDWPSSFRQ